MLHLTAADYTRQPWKNGRGETTELWRLDRNGRLLLRLSRAAVVEDGPFSVFPGIERNLTVLSGPGFRLSGDGFDLRCDPLIPVAFPGDAALSAYETAGRPSEDFNVMTACDLPKPRVVVTQDLCLPTRGLVALFALEPCTTAGVVLSTGELLLTEAPLEVICDKPLLVVWVDGLSGP